MFLSSTEIANKGLFTNNVIQKLGGPEPPPLCEPIVRISPTATSTDPPPAAADLDWEPLLLLLLILTRSPPKNIRAAVLTIFEPKFQCLRPMSIHFFTFKKKIVVY